MEISITLMLFVFYRFLTVSINGQRTMMTGLRYKNYTNYVGTMSDGTCCDNPGLTAPNCPPDQCDTSFLPCATFIGGAQCGAYYKDPTPTMVDENFFALQTQIGNIRGKSASNVKVLLSSFSSADIHFKILAQEITHNNKALIAEFNFVIDWMDSYYHPTDHWRPLILKDTHAEIGIDVLRQCFIFWHGPTCSVYCKQTHQYTCLPDGSKSCTTGWQGPNCTDVASTIPTSTQNLNAFTTSRSNPFLPLHIFTSALNNPFSASTLPTLVSGLRLTGMNVSSNQIAVSKTSRSNPNHASDNGGVIAIVTISVSVGLFVSGVLLTSLLYCFDRMKKMRAIQKVQPSPSSCVSDRE